MNSCLRYIRVSVPSGDLGTDARPQARAEVDEARHESAELRRQVEALEQQQARLKARAVDKVQGLYDRIAELEAQLEATSSDEDESIQGGAGAGVEAAEGSSGAGDARTAAPNHPEAAGQGNERPPLAPRPQSISVPAPKVEDVNSISPPPALRGALRASFSRPPDSTDGEESDWSDGEDEAQLPPADGSDPPSRPNDDAVLDDPALATYVREAMQDWCDDHPGVSPEGNADWLEERKLVIAEFITP